MARPAMALAAADHFFVLKTAIQVFGGHVHVVGRGSAVDQARSQKL